MPNYEKVQAGVGLIQRLIREQPQISQNAIIRELKAQGLSYGSRQEKLNDIRAIRGQTERRSPVGIEAASKGGRVSGLKRLSESKEYEKRQTARERERAANRAGKQEKAAEARARQMEADRNLLAIRAHKAGMSWKAIASANYLQLLQYLYPENFGEPDFEPDDYEESA